MTTFTMPHYSNLRLTGCRTGVSEMRAGLPPTSNTQNLSDTLLLPSSCAPVQVLVPPISNAACEFSCGPVVCMTGMLGWSTPGQSILFRPTLCQSMCGRSTLELGQSTHGWSTRSVSRRLVRTQLVDIGSVSPWLVRVDLRTLGLSPHSVSARSVDPHSDSQHSVIQCSIGPPSSTAHNSQCLLGPDSMPG